jgi:hypothetical protein
MRTTRGERFNGDLLRERDIRTDSGSLRPPVGKRKSGYADAVPHSTLGHVAPASR